MEVLDFLHKIAAKGGKIGGKRSLETMTKAERKARALKASRAAAKARTKAARDRRKAQKGG